MENLILKFSPENKTFICRKIDKPDLSLLNENVFYLEVYTDTREGEGSQIYIPQADLHISLK